MTSKLNVYVSKAVSITICTIGGAIIGGIPGAVIGLSVVLIDEYLIDNNVNDKHYYTSTLFWFSTSFKPLASKLTKTFPAEEYKIPIHAISVALSMIVPHLRIDFLDFRSRISLPVDSSMLLSKFFDDDNVISEKELYKVINLLKIDPLEGTKLLLNDCYKLYQNDFIWNFFASTSLTISKTISNQFFLQYLGVYSANLFVTTLISHHSNTLNNAQKYLPKNYIIDGGKIISIFLIKGFIEYGIDIAISHVSTNQFNSLVAKVTDIIISHPKIKDILSTDEGKMIVTKLIYDSYYLQWEVVKSLENLVSNTAESMIYFRKIMSISTDSMLPFLFIEIIKEKYFLMLVENSREISEELAAVDVKIWDLRFKIIENIEPIILRDAQNFMKDKYLEYLTTESRLKYQVKSVENAKEFGNKNLFSHLNAVISYLYSGYKFMTKQLSIDDIVIVQLSINGVNRFFSDTIIRNLDTQNHILMKERVERFFELLSKDYSDKAKHHYIDENKIMLNDYHLMLNNVEIFSIDNLEFEYGKYYAITGKSGCGKTTVLMDIKSGVSGDMSSNGVIYAPNNRSIMFIDQKLYLPKDEILLNTVYFPGIVRILTEEQKILLKEKIIFLFKELSIDEFVHDDNSTVGLISNLETTNFKLSGGQLKKIAIIQAILNNPNILILDETLAGLDKKSLIQIEKLLKKYLPNSLVLIVDHHAHDNNYNHFYDYEVHFDNQTVNITAIESTLYDEILL